MEPSLLNTYLRDLEQELRAKGLADPETLAEIESHLLEAIEHGVQGGLSRPQAEQRALQRFGSVKTVSSAFKERISSMQKAFLVVAALAGLLITYIDSSPGWDDTGISAGLILLTCGFLALLGFQRPWLLALLVGGWIPLYGLLITHNTGSILALVIALIGAYAGWAVRRGFIKVFHTT